MAVTLYELLKSMVEKGASDLHITTGTPARFRIDGRLLPMGGDILNAADTKSLCYSVLTDAQKQSFEETSELDFSFGLKGVSRFRGNVFMQRGAVAGVFRAVAFAISGLADLGLPPIVSDLARKPRGLVLVTGPTGCGKSTTLASMVDLINTERSCHIVTVEDPIEYLHAHKKSQVNQREVTADTLSFKNALRHILRQDPDVVLIGEMRDLETIEAALTVSETGHLTLATLHTNSAVQTLNRIIDVFPPHQQEQVRVQLSFVLEGVVSQQLLPRKNSAGRVLAVEVMIPNVAIRNLIREDKLHQVYASMQTGQAQSGMQTMNQSLIELMDKNLISFEEAAGHSTMLDEFLSAVKKENKVLNSRR